MDKIIIQGIKPFNEIYYKSCFYNSLLSLMNYYDLSINPILSTDIYMYKSIGSIPEIHCVECQDADDVVNKFGTLIDKVMECENLFEYLLKSLSSMKPTIIWIDRYYLSFRKDSYLKVHASHTLLIYGYDKGKKTFNIIEHEYAENTNYREMIISYNDLFNSYNGFLANFFEEGRPSIYVFPPTLTYRDNSWDEKNTLCDNLMLHRNEIDQSLLCLKEYQNEFCSLIQNEELFTKKGSKILEKLNEVVSAKKVEKYRIDHIFSDDVRLREAHKSILGEWVHIRNNVGKCVFSQRYLANLLAEVKSRLNTIYLLECKQNEWIRQLHENQRKQ